MILLHSSMPLGVCCYSHKWYFKNFRVSFDFLRTDGVYLRWSTLLIAAGKKHNFLCRMVVDWHLSRSVTNTASLP